MNESLTLLLAETDGKLRNRLAIALTDNQAPGIEAALLHLIKCPDNVDNRGTFVWCLNAFAGRHHLQMLAKLVIEGNWEVAHEAMSVAAEIDLMAGEEERDALQALENAHGITEADWREDLIAEFAGRLRLVASSRPIE